MKISLETIPEFVRFTFAGHGDSLSNTAEDNDENFKRAQDIVNNTSSDEENFLGEV